MAITQDVVINTQKALSSLKVLNKNVQNLGKTSTQTGSRIGGLGRIAGGAFAGLIAYRIGSELLGQFKMAVSGALEFSKALGEIETLLPEAERNTDRLSTSLIRLSNTYGQDAQKQARGFYDIVSAGVKGFDNQLRVLDVTNKVAIGGITDTATATNLLVTTMNAFSAQGETAESVADALFTTVKQGVTTIPQLASSLGQVNAIAANSGVTLKEVGASMAQLTANGLNTAEASTALRAAIVSFSKPSKEAQKIVKSLGIEFSTAALQQNGFAKTLERIQKATGGNTATLQKLFPNVRAQAAVMNLLGRNWESFNRQIKEFNDTSGATNSAFARISQTASFQIDRFRVGLSNLVKVFQQALDSDIAALFKEMADYLESDGPYIFAAGLATALDVVNKITQGVRSIQFLFNRISISSLESQLKRLNAELKTGATNALGFSVGFSTKGAESLRAEIAKVEGQLKSAQSSQDALLNRNRESVNFYDNLTKKILEIPQALRKANTEADKLAKASGGAGGGEPPLAKGFTVARKEADSYAQSLLTIAGFRTRLNKVDLESIKDETKRHNARVKLQKDAASEIGALTKSAFGEYKAFQIAEATVSTYSAANKALAAFPPPFSYIAAAAAVAAGLANVSKIAGLSFQQGGVVPGNQFEGDRVLARVNSGELILNRQQQSSLFNAIDSGNLGAGQAQNITVNVSSLTGDIPQRSLDRMIDQIRERVIFGNKRFV